jgi:putative isomerase
MGWYQISGEQANTVIFKDLSSTRSFSIVSRLSPVVCESRQPNGISYDRTEPPIGSKVLHETFKRWQEPWIVELLFDDCYDWTQWFFRRREDAPLGLIVLGSDKIADTSDTPNMQAARYESGLDNSPMYDGNFFSYNTTLQSGHMHLYLFQC